MDWILENWQLIASVFLALVNLAITLIVHARSGKKISDLADKDGDGIPDQLEELLRINSQLLERIKNEKEAK